MVGFTLELLAEVVGVSGETVGAIRQGRRVYVRVSVAQAITAAYTRLWNADPVELGVSRAGVVRAKSWASKHGWEPPAAWDDIDDPACMPDTGVRENCGRDELAAYRRSEIAHLAAFGVPDGEIAARLGMPRRYVHDLIQGMHAPGARTTRRSVVA
ncbi:hypothetical protein [Streptomyces luteireticuli]|uniref:hypothetical protein n=1 Tax=Streptomyces luteireticuli TaxID=173858 RepID=UPI003558572E